MPIQIDFTTPDVGPPIGSVQATSFQFSPKDKDARVPAGKAQAGDLVFTKNTDAKTIPLILAASVGSVFDLAILSQSAADKPAFLTITMEKVGIVSVFAGVGQDRVALRFEKVSFDFPDLTPVTNVVGTRAGLFRSVR